MQHSSTKRAWLAIGGNGCRSAAETLTAHARNVGSGSIRIRKNLVQLELFDLTSHRRYLHVQLGFLVSGAPGTPRTFQGERFCIEMLSTNRIADS